MVRDVEDASTTEGLPISPSMGPALSKAGVPARSTLVDARVVWLSIISIALAVMAACIAEILIHLIGLVTNISFYGHLSGPAVPTTEHLGLWVIVVPVIGGLIVGFMARYGSKAIRGHGIPEAMEQVLLNQSRIPPRMTFLKPLSAAIAIGTGGPFGAEGPIIATGGALGSLIGQMMSTTAIGAQDTARRRRGGGHGGDVRQPGVGRAAGGRAAAVRIPPAIAHSRRAGERDGGGSADRVFDGAQPIFAMPDHRDASRRGAGGLHSDRRDHRRGGGFRHARGLCGRGCVRASADALDVVAGDRRGRGRRRRLLCAAHARRRLLQHHRHHLGKPRR